MSMPVAVLAGGLATRLRPVTGRIPKCLVKVSGRPFGEHQVRLLHSRGLFDIIFLVGHMGELVRETLGDGSQWGVRIRYVFDGPRPLGTGGAIRAAIGELGDSFLVLYGDSYLECDYAAVAEAFGRTGKLGLMTVFRNDGRWDRSNVVFDDGRILKYDKVLQTGTMRHIDYGLGVFKRAAFEPWPPGAAFDLEAVYQSLLQRNELAGYEVTERFYEIGSPAGLEETRAYLDAKGDRQE